MFVEIQTGFAMSDSELYDIYLMQYDGGDDTNYITFDEWLQGFYYEQDANGDYFPCYFART